MTTVEEYVGMAEEAQGDNAHVAVLSFYRDALEETRYSPNAAHILSAAIKYASKLKKDRDRDAIVLWGTAVLDKMKPNADLVQTINEEIAKLKTSGGKENAAQP